MWRPLRDRRPQGIPTYTDCIGPATAVTLGSAAREAGWVTEGLTTMERSSGSPIEAGWVAQQRAACDELTSANGELWYIESDPELGGASRLMRCAPGEKPMAVTPEGIEVGSWLHAYGGGAYAVTSAGVWFVNAENSRVFFLDTATRRCLPIAPDDGLHYGDLRTSPHGVLAVRESADGGDQIVEIMEDATIRVLVESPGFLAAPTVRDGQLAFLMWDVDEMPWDSSRLCLTSYGSPTEEATVTTIAGGPDESVTEAQWGPDGGLYFLSDRTGWWNLYCWSLDGVRRVFSVDQDCCPAPWEAGYRSYAFLPDGSLLISVHDGFRVRLGSIDAEGRLTLLRSELSSIKPYLAVLGSQVGVIGSSASLAPRVRLLELGTRGNAAEVGTTDNSSTRGAVSTATIQQADTPNGTVKFLLRHALGATAVPLLVRAHPGPTDNVPLRLDWTAEYFVTRGFAVVDVAYRGSSGFGRSFRRALYGHWGEYDVEDCAAVAQHLLATGIAREGAVFISGASAGGYTALQAAQSRGPFTAATATSAIIDPTRWAITAPRFQRSYAMMLAGPRPAVQAEGVSIPVLLIHGTSDPIAPAADARQLATELREHGMDHETLFLDGGGHYLSDPRSRAAALQAEAHFYSRFIEAGS